MMSALTRDDWDSPAGRLLLSLYAAIKAADRGDGWNGPTVVDLVTQTFDIAGLDLTLGPDQLDTDNPYDQGTAEHSAYAIGHSHGAAVGSWVTDGNTSDDTARWLLRGLDYGDSEVLDLYPGSPLSGEWADGYTTSDLVMDVFESVDRGYTMDEEASAGDAYEQGHRDGWEYEVKRAARHQLGEDAP